MSKIAETQKKKTTWSTWDELLLAFSVKRHGLKDWDSVAMELRNRSSLPALLTTAQICKEKYRDLKRRFTNSDTIVEEDEGGDVVIPWLEDLRQLRVAELKQEVHHRDLSIQSLKLKVKRMEEEREQSMKERQEMAMKPDLEDGRKENSANDVTADGGGEKPDGIVREVVSGGNSDGENRSFNESNSVEKREPDPVHGIDPKPDPQVKPARENSCKDSSNRHEASKTSQESKGNDVANDARKEGSDVESSACLKMKRRKRGEAAGGEQVAAMMSPAIAATKRAGAVKSEPLVRLLDVIRSHKHGSVFKHRLQVQKTAKYKSIIWRHVDLETVQARIDDGSYSSCSTELYLDLLLLFNNAIVFFPKSSPESVAAHQLRSLVMKELKNINNKTPLSSSTTPPPPTKVQPDPEQDSSDSLLPKRSCTAAPIVVCRRRSSISAKAAASGDDDTISPKEDDSLAKLKMKERPVTDKKRSAAADFLKRINKSSPTKGTSSVDTQKKSPPDVKDGDGRRQPKRNATKMKDAPAARQTRGGNAAKKLKEESFPAKRSVGRPRRDAASASDKLVKEHDKDDSSKRPKKRFRS
nr:ankyrin repeat, bromo and BTB domain-containing protein DDB_G0293800 [Ipomoea batatas]